MTEFSRKVAIARLGREPRPHSLAAEPHERASLAERFGLLALDRLEAVLEVWREGEGARLTGRLRAEAAQPCVLTGEPVPATLDCPLALVFAADEPAAEVELDADDLDTMPIEGGLIDLGEAVAQSLALALPQYPRANQAAPALEGLVISEEEAARRSAEAGRPPNPFDVLKG